MVIEKIVNNALISSEGLVIFTVIYPSLSDTTVFTFFNILSKYNGTFRSLVINGFIYIVEKNGIKLPSCVQWTIERENRGNLVLKQINSLKIKTQCINKH